MSRRLCLQRSWYKMSEDCDLLASKEDHGRRGGTKEASLVSDGFRCALPILRAVTALQTHLLSAKSRHPAADRTASGISGIVDCGPDSGHDNIDVNDPLRN
jgi:hypothetical protein